MEHRPFASSNGHGSSSSTIARRRLSFRSVGARASSGAGARPRLRAPPLRATARSTRATSIDVTYGSRPVIPNRQHSVDAGHVSLLSRASTSRYTVSSSCNSAVSACCSLCRGCVRGARSVGLDRDIVDVWRICRTTCFTVKRCDDLRIGTRYA